MKSRLAIPGSECSQASSAVEKTDELLFEPVQSGKYGQAQPKFKHESQEFDRADLVHEHKIGQHHDRYRTNGIKPCEARFRRRGLATWISCRRSRSQS